MTKILLALAVTSFSMFAHGDNVPTTPGVDTGKYYAELLVVDYAITRVAGAVDLSQNAICLAAGYAQASLGILQTLGMSDADIDQALSGLSTVGVTTAQVRTQLTTDIATCTK